MDTKFVPALLGSAAIAIVIGLAPAPVHAQTPAVSVDPATMPRIGTVNPRFMSYNIEMAEVTGGTFWKPYGSKGAPAVSSQPSKDAAPAGMSPDLYQYRPPIDLSNPRLRKLAKALGPEYVRVSGTWANSVYFADSDRPPAKAPTGFSSVLTRKQWKGVIDFVHAVNGALVTSFATSPGTRNAQGVWDPKEADKWLAYTKSIGGHIAATEFMNEPTYAAMGGAPKGYDAADYGRDIAVFGPWLKKHSPGTLFLGPGSVGEGPFALPMGNAVLHSADLLKATGPAFPVFSYHLYAAASQRCAAAIGAKGMTTAADALSADWLSRPVKIDEYYAGLRDRFDPGKPLWITETADTACGGNPWASTFLDTFRYLVMHASLAQRGVQVIMHNTLASSDYGLLDQNTFEPRPNYWATLLWHRLMGTTVLNPHVATAPNTYVYAQCLEVHPGGVTLLVINADKQHSFTLDVPKAGERYTLTAKRLEDTAIELNGHSLQLTSNGDLPPLAGQPVKAGSVSFAPTSITFLAVPKAGNGACR